MDMRVREFEPFVPPYPARPEKAPLLAETLFGATARNPVTMWSREAFELPTLSRNILGVNYHVVSAPDLIRRVLVEAPATYVRPRVLAGLIQPSGSGLVLAEGDDWRRQRRVMAPVFTPAAVAGFLPMFGKAAQATAGTWPADGQPVDIAAAATATAFEVISRALFSTGLDLAPAETARHVRRLMTASTAVRPSVLILLSLLDGIPRIGPGMASGVVLTRKVRQLVEARRRDADPPHDFVTRLLEAFGEDHMPAQAARKTVANALTFMIAGHETTASAIAFTLYLLACQPQAQAWAAEDARDALSAATPGEALERLTYLRWVLDEALRLYPPGLRLERQATADDRLGDLEVRKGDLVAVWPWLVHRHRALWASPDAFDPENFSPEAKVGRHRFQYLPFGAGPRVCIGGHFATQEALLVLAHWLARFEFSPAPGCELELASDITLKPKGPLPLIVRRRPD